MNWLSPIELIVVVLLLLGTAAFLCCAWIGAQWRYQSESWAPDEVGGEDE